MFPNLPALVRISEEKLGQHTIWRMTQNEVGELVVAARGATVLSWRVPGVVTSLLDGYETLAEFEEIEGYRNAVLAPWSNRIRNSQYKFAGKEYDFGPDKDGKREAIHGLICKLNFVRDTSIADELVLRATLLPSEAYPYKLDICVTYMIAKGANQDMQLTMSVEAVNVGEQTAPIALGWHPYVRLPHVTEIDKIQLLVPARSHVLVDKALIPLPGDAAWAGDNCPVVFETLKGKQLDRAYTDLVPDEDGVSRTVLRDPDNGQAMILVQSPLDAAVVHIYTADGLARNNRAVVALEPCTHMTDAFNRPEIANTIGVKPGEKRSLMCDLIYRRSMKNL